MRVMALHSLAFCSIHFWARLFCGLGQIRNDKNSITGCGKYFVLIIKNQSFGSLYKLNCNVVLGTKTIIWFEEIISTKGL